MSFLGLNPPDHTRLRRLALPAFSPKAVARLRRPGSSARSPICWTGPARRAGSTWSPASPRRCRSPSSPTCSASRTPVAADFARYGTVIGSALDGVKSMRHARQLHGGNEPICAALRAPLRAAAARAAATTSSAAWSRPKATRSSRGEMLPMCVLLLVAGFETTVNLISNAVLALLGHPAAVAGLVRRPGRAGARGGRGGAALGSRRCSAPAGSRCEPVELEGQPVRQGEQVVTLIGAANRDPAGLPRSGHASTSCARAHPRTSPSPAASTTASASRWPALEATIALRMLADADARPGP